MSMNNAVQVSDQSGKKNPNRSISSIDRAETMKNPADLWAKNAGLAKLDALVGLKESKEQIKKIIAFHAIRKFAATQGKKLKNISYHMEFIGNPGTAKTTTARLVAQIMYEQGITATNKFIEASRADLVGEYAGHTAMKTKKLVGEAYGGVLFIDEAYSLMEDRAGGFGDEAINSLVVEIENHRNDMVVILAGYPKEMAHLFECNPGLRSRIPFTVNFPDYSLSELLEITKLIAEENGYSLGNDVQDKLTPIFEAAMKGESFGNGRFVRNLVENAQLTKAASLMNNHIRNLTVEECFTLSASDFDQVCLPDDHASRKVIGFS